MPFVLYRRNAYIHIKTKEITMNWIFEAYSNVYNTALMNQSVSAPRRRHGLARLLGKR
jgi:hypothetical protein